MSNHKMKVAAGLASAVFAVGLCSVAPSASADPTLQAINGQVQCTDGAVVGIWVEATNGGNSGFANWSPAKGDIKIANFTYSGTSAGNTYELHVGCGGSAQSWDKTAYSAPISVTTIHLICNTIPGWDNWWGLGRYKCVGS